MNPSATSPADSDLLQAYARKGDPVAFRMLVERYTGLVYATAFRRLGEAMIAEEVASDVFALLARKAGQLTEPGCLAAWLQRSAVLVAANAARKEQRRKNAMNDYAASQPGETTVTDDAWQDVLPHLDESLAQLPERDRKILAARYFSGQAHAQIAREQGGTEEAVKKAAQRALEKLTGILRRRGVGVSAAVLAAGMTDHLQAGVSAGMATRISASAALKAESLGAFSSINHAIALMLYGKTLALPAALLILCPLLGTGSYLTARQVAQSSVIPQGESNIRVMAKAPPAAPRMAKFPDKRSIADIMQEAVKLLRTGKQNGPEQDRALMLFASLSTGEIKQAAAAAEAYREDEALASHIAVVLAAAWAERDPEAALGWLEYFPRKIGNAADRGAGNIVLTWFDRNAPAAWAWWLKRGLSPKYVDFSGFAGSGMSSWARRDPVAAITAIGQVKDGSEAIIKALAWELSQVSLKADSPAVEAALRWSNASLRAELARGLAANSGSSDLPSQLFPVLNKLCADDPEALEAAVAPRIKDWARSAPDKAAAWIIEQTANTPANTMNLLQPALQTWVKKSPGTAWQWLDQVAGSAPGQAARLYGAVLEDINVSRGGKLDISLDLPAAWAGAIAESPPDSQERFLQYWAERAVSGQAASEGLLDEWRQKTANASDSPQSRLSLRALRIAETLNSRPQ